MLLIIHNLPPRMRYADVKALIVSKCFFKKLVLDEMVSDGRNTKVTVGLAREEDVMILVRQINGLFLEGRKLYVEDLRQEKHSEQDLSQTQDYASPKTDFHRSNTQQFNSTPYMNYQQDKYVNYTPGGQLENPVSLTSVNPNQVMPMMMGMNMEGFYMPQEQNSYMDYTGQSQQFSQSATKHPQFSGQQEQPGYRSDYQTRKDDEWSAHQPRVQFNEFHEDTFTDNSHRYQSTYESDRQQSVNHSGGWAEEGDVNTLRRRSRSPRNQRERSYDRSSLSPKRRRHENYNRDVSRNSSNSNRDFNRYTSDHDETYGAQTYGTNYQDKPRAMTSEIYGYRNHNKPYCNNDPITATSFNKQPLMSRPSQNKGEEESYNPAIQHQMFGQLSDSDTYEDKPQVARWDRKVTSPLDSRSNYRNHMQKKAAQDLSKNNWRNPAQTSWDIQDTTSHRSGSRSQYSWRSPGLNENNPEVTSFGDRNCASDKGKLQLGKKLKIPQTLGKRYEGSSYNKPQPTKNAPKGESNFETKWPKKNKSKGKMSVKQLIRQDSNWRFKAASQIANEIANANPYIIKKEYLVHLKKSVRARLDMLLAEKFEESIPDMVAIYRAKFPPREDYQFCQLVVQQIQTEPKRMVNLTEGIKQVKPSMQAPKKQPTGQKSLPISQPNADKSQPKAGKSQLVANKSQPIAGTSQPIAGKSQPKAGKSQPVASKSQPIAGKSQPVLPRLQVPKSSEKLPTYPNSDKRMYKEQKKLKKLEHQNEDLYKLSPLQEKALDEELKIITDVFNSVAGNPDSESEKEFCKHFLSVGLEQVRKKYQMAVSGIASSLVPVLVPGSETSGDANTAVQKTCPESLVASKAPVVLSAASLVPDISISLNTSTSVISEASNALDSATPKIASKLSSPVTSQVPNNLNDIPKSFFSGDSNSQNAESLIKISELTENQGDNLTSQALPGSSHVIKTNKKKMSKAQRKALRRIKFLAAKNKRNEILAVPTFESKSTAPVVLDTNTDMTTLKSALPIACEAPNASTASTVQNSASATISSATPNIYEPASCMVQSLVNICEFTRNQRDSLTSQPFPGSSNAHSEPNNVKPLGAKNYKKKMSKAQRKALRRTKFLAAKGQPTSKALVEATSPTSMISNTSTESNISKSVLPMACVTPNTSLRISTVQNSASVSVVPNVTISSATPASCMVSLVNICEFTRNQRDNLTSLPLPGSSNAHAEPNNVKPLKAKNKNNKKKISRAQWRELRRMKFLAAKGQPNGTLAVPSGHASSASNAPVLLSENACFKTTSKAPVEATSATSMISNTSTESNISKSVLPMACVTPNTSLRISTVQNSASVSVVPNVTISSATPASCMVSLVNICEFTRNQRDNLTSLPLPGSSNAHAEPNNVKPIKAKYKNNKKTMSRAQRRELRRMKFLAAKDQPNGILAVPSEHAASASNAPVLFSKNACFKTSKASIKDTSVTSAVSADTCTELNISKSSSSANSAAPNGVKYVHPNPTTKMSILDKYFLLQKICRVQRKAQTEY